MSTELQDIIIGRVEPQDEAKYLEGANHRVELSQALHEHLINLPFFSMKAYNGSRAISQSGAFYEAVYKKDVYTNEARKQKDNGDGVTG